MSLNNDKGQLENNFMTEVLQRKKYFNMVQDLQGKIRVWMRIRPQSIAEKDNNCKSCLTIMDD